MSALALDMPALSRLLARVLCSARRGLLMVEVARLPVRAPLIGSARVSAMFAFDKPSVEGHTLRTHFKVLTVLGLPLSGKLAGKILQWTQAGRHFGVRVQRSAGWWSGSLWLETTLPG